MQLTLDSAAISAAAADLGIDAARLAKALAAAVPARRTIATAEGGGAPKRAGRAWERTVVDHANAAGFSTWERAPLRGARDLLDIQGTLPDGLLIGTKALSRTASEAQKLAPAMDQCHRAMANLALKVPAAIDIDDVIPWQILQRAGKPVGQAYAVTEYDYFLKLAAERPRRRRQPSRRK
jgi:hypothetical protein